MLFTGRAIRGHLFLLLVLVSLLAGCASAPATLPAAPEQAIQWPPLPAKARIVWVKSISGYGDTGIAKGFWSHVLEFFTGKEDQGIVRPHGLAHDRGGRLVIADPGSKRVHLMDVPGRNYSVITGGDQRLESPIGVAEDDDGGLYITDSRTAIVWRYDLAKQSMAPFLRGKLRRPTGMTYSRKNGLLYVVDTLANLVVAFDRAGNERFRFGAAGNGDPGLNHPTDIAVDRQGRLYITDPLNYRVRVYSAEGSPVTSVGAAGDAPGTINKAKGVAVDSDGHIYLCDALHDGVQIFDMEGRFLLFFGGNGTGPGSFWMPSGIAIDDNDFIYVSDTYNQRVQVFRYVSDRGPQSAAETPAAR